LTDSTIDSSFANCINSGYLLRVAKAPKTFHGCFGWNRTVSKQFFKLYCFSFVSVSLQLWGQFYKTRPTRLCAEPRYFTAQ